MAAKSTPEENIYKAQRKKNELGRALYEQRDAPLVERLRSLEDDLGGRRHLADLVYAAIHEAHERGELDWSYTTRHLCQQHLRQLLMGQRVSGMQDNIYEALLYAVNELEDEEEKEEVPPSSEMRKLQKALEQNGFYELVPSGGGHLKLVTGPHHPSGRGRTVQSERGGPIVLPSTPSDHRWRKNAVTRLRKAAFAGIPVLTSDPFEGPVQERELPKNEISFQEQKRLEGIEQRNRNNIEQTSKARFLAEPIVAKLGSWDNPNFVHELADVILFYGRSGGYTRWFNLKGEATHEGVVKVLRRLHRGETLSEPSHEGVITFFTDLAEADDPVERYMGLLRESKGVKEKPPLQEAIRALAEPEEPTPEEVWREQKQAIREAAALQPIPVREDAPVVVNGERSAEPWPAADRAADPWPAADRAAEAALLALELVYEMVVGRENPDRDTVLALAMRVYRLEAR